MVPAPAISQALPYRPGGQPRFPAKRLREVVTPWKWPPSFQHLDASGLDPLPPAIPVPSRRRSTALESRFAFDDMQSSPRSSLLLTIDARMLESRQMVASWNRLTDLLWRRVSSTIAFFSSIASCTT